MLQIKNLPETRSICVVFSSNVPLVLDVCSPLCGPTIASTTLITQCTPYFRPIPTVLPLTSTNPSLPIPSEAPQLHLNYHI